MVTRGAVFNPGRASQLRDYRGLRFGKITPTDIDGLIEYKDKGYVLFELKYGDTQLPWGQRIAFERLVRDIQKCKPILGIIATHWTPEGEDIDAAAAKVDELWYRGRKIPPSFPGQTIRDATTKFLNALDAGTETVLPAQVNWQYGVTCGLSGKVCKLCQGVPCSGSKNSMNYIKDVAA